MRAACSTSTFTVSPVRPSGGVEQVSVLPAGGVDGGESCIGCDEALLARAEAAPQGVEAQEKIDECATQECEADRRSDYRRETLRRGEPVAIAKRPSGGGVLDAVLWTVCLGNPQCQSGSAPDRGRGSCPTEKASFGVTHDRSGPDSGTLSRKGGRGSTRCRAQVGVKD